MATVALLATGGTIASTGGADGRVPTASGRDLLRQAGLGGGDPPVPVRELELGGSFSWDLERMRRVIEEIRGCLAAPVRGTDGARPDGVVVTHGTDTMEETVFLASLLLDDPRPVVLTGAQQPYDSRSPDGPENLRDAFAVAAAPSARGRGPLLCFDGLVFAARGVTKVDTLSHRAFGAPGRGPVLRVHDGRVTALAPPGPPHPLPGVDLDTGLPRVDVVALYPGADEALLRAAAETGAAGLVLAAPGTGNTAPRVAREVARLTGSGVPVLVCSRVPSGPAVPLYGGGGGVDLARAGAVFAGDLSPWQARLLLAVALAATRLGAARAVSGWLDG
ncbi:asparaginase [Streptomyces diastaticus]|uniref:asparaginase n=1 Tax=Streptomyces diastaticus subsp. diastaticus TaxID=68040 RepID=A0ABQ1CUH0_STRDI|nr:MULTISPECIES: asparaginase [Streptomyces]NEE60791.1 asparaginase [Streptomyces sp. SID8455]MDQ0296414.1 L-asparaginase [Streptomyces sp. DSM 41037]RPK86927.1 L-asparaginase [Streptomyces sp. ADI98-12]GFH73977.1 putative L-asparaginase [Streptomyces diastaticus subsp. diastaticus]GGU28467.1 putative L-asparaginase [Streptomyces diastaticus subsp. diastaticus]